MRFCFNNKNFVVVGASSGIGRQIAFDLAEAGANVLAVARNEERLSNLQGFFPEKIEIAIVDVLKATNDDWKKILGNFVGKVGKCHGGIYTAGIGGISDLRGFDQEVAHQIFDTSLYGMLVFWSSFIKKKNVVPGSSFVAFSSVAAQSGEKGSIAYSAAKAAVRTSVKSIAKEICRDKHRINSISPGWVNTEMTRQSVMKNGMKSYEEMLALHRLGMGKPEDVSGITLFLLSDAAHWITGTDIVVDGGYLLGID